MPFTQSTFAPISSHGNSDMPNIWTYRTADSFATLSSEGYFIDKYPILNNGDVIMANASDKEAIGFFVLSGGKFTVDEYEPGGNIKVAANEIIINKEADFDNQDATTITLSPGVQYKVGDNLSSSKNVIGSGAVVEGLGGATIWTYTGSEPNMFTSTDSIFGISNITLDAPGKTVFSVNGDDSGNVNHRSNISSVVVLNCDKFIDSVGAGANVLDTVQVANCTGSKVIEISNSSAVVHSFSSLGLFGLTAGSTAIDLGNSVSDEIELINVIVSGDATATSLSGLPSSGNISSGNLGSVVGCSFSSSTTPLSGISEEDVRWDFSSNSGVSSTVTEGMVSLEGNTTETVIAAIDVPVKINATWISEDLSRFTHDGTGRLTYIGERDARRSIDLSGTLLSASGGDKQLSACIHINGVAIPSTCQQVTASSSKSGGVTCSWLHTFKNGDYIEGFVFNSTNTTNIVFQQGVARVS